MSLYTKKFVNLAQQAL